MKKYGHFFCGLLLTVFFLAGCETPPAPDAGFIDGSQTAHREGSPFQRSWVQEGVDWKGYKGIYIAPVNTSHVLSSGSWKAVAKYGDADEDLQKEAQYMRDTFIKAFQEDPNKRFTVVDTPSARDLILEMAIVELTPNSPAMKAAEFVPIAGWGVKAINKATPDYVSFEARIRDGATGTILATAADRRKAKTALVNVQDYTWYGHADAIIKDWAKEFVEIANKRPGEIVKKSPGYQLKPW
jgi:hypothetical protein